MLQSNCGIVNPKNEDRCHKKVDNSIKNGFIQPMNLLFSKNLKNKELIGTIEDIQTEVALYQTNPEYSAPELLLKEVKRIVTTSNKT